jgi:hypothetical protein
MGTGVTALRGTDAVEEVVLRDGRVEAADVVVVGVGVTPRVELAVAAGLRVDGGTSSTSTCGPARPACTQQATSPPPGTRDAGAACASSTGPTRSTRARPLASTPSPVGARPTHTCRTSSPTSTTSAPSTSALPSQGTPSSSAAAWPTGGSSPSGIAAASSPPPCTSTCGTSSTTSPRSSDDSSNPACSAIPPSPSASSPRPRALSSPDAGGGDRDHRQPEQQLTQTGDRRRQRRPPQPHGLRRGQGGDRDAGKRGAVAEAIALAGGEAGRLATDRCRRNHAARAAAAGRGCACRTTSRRPRAARRSPPAPATPIPTNGRRRGERAEDRQLGGRDVAATLARRSQRRRRTSISTSFSGVRTRHATNPAPPAPRPPPTERPTGRAAPAAASAPIQAATRPSDPTECCEFL